VTRVRLFGARNYWQNNSHGRILSPILDPLRHLPPLSASSVSSAAQRLADRALISMRPISDAYRAKAAACLLAAKRLELPDVRARWLAMAEAWNRLADETDRRALYEALGHQAEISPPLQPI
jgi:hypothetical protein